MNEHEENPMSCNFATKNDYGSTAALIPTTERTDNDIRRSSFSVETTTPASTLERKTTVNTSERNSYPNTITTTSTSTNSSSSGTKSKLTSTKSFQNKSPPTKRRLFPRMSDTLSNTARPGSPARFAKMSMDNRGAAAAHMLPNSETHQIMERVEFILNIINQMCIGFVTIYMSWLCLHYGLAGTALHAWLVTLGFSFLMAEAIMCHYNCNLLTHHLKRTTKTMLHWILQIIGGGLGIAGVLIKCIQKDFLLTSTHGKLGFSAFILCLVSLVSGLTALFSIRLRKLIAPLFTKTIHNLLGLTTFIIAMLAQFYGYQTGFFIRRTEYDFQNLMKILTLIILVLTSIGPLKALFHKLVNLRRHFK